MFLDPNEQVEKEESSGAGAEAGSGAESDPTSVAATEVLTEATGEDYIRIKRSHFNLLLIAILVPLAFLLGISSGYVIWGDNQIVIADTVSDSPAGSSDPVATEEVPRFDIPVDDDPYLGPEDAPIVIVEFSDFNCGFCRRFHLETFNEILDSYPDQIRFVYRDFPITSAESFVAAQAAQCAFEQGEFWEYHDLLFSGQLPLGRETYEAYASELGLDSDELLNCIDSERYVDEVNEDASFASGLGVSGTPTFFINGIPLVGAQPFSQFAQVIEQELAN